LIDSREVQLSYRSERFIEEQTLPVDAQVVGQAWAKSNRDGSPDRRFRDNYQIPVALYGNLVFTSASGLHEEYQVSNCLLAERFATGWHRFHASLSTPRTPDRRMSTGSTMDVETTWLSDDVDPATAFVNESEKARALVTERGPYWEVLLTEELLRRKLASLQRAYETMDTAVIPSATREFGGREVIKWFVEQSGKPGLMRNRLSAYVRDDLPASWGEPGEAGEPVKILAAGNLPVACCRDLAKWELDIYLADTPKKLRPLSRAVRGFAIQAMSEVNRIPDALARAVERAGSRERDFKIQLVFTDPPQTERLVAEVRKIAERIEK